MRNSTQVRSLLAVAVVAAAFTLMGCQNTGGSAQSDKGGGVNVGGTGMVGESGPGAADIHRGVGNDAGPGAPSSDTGGGAGPGVPGGNVNGATNGTGTGANGPANGGGTASGTGSGQAGTTGAAQ
jgi:hypothetical protein